MKAHDVRHLTVCPSCHQLGDDRKMVPCDGAHLHGACFIAAHGLPKLLEQPAKVLNCLTLGDIGGDAMRALMDFLAPRKRAGEHRVG